jgi:cytochrome c556
VRKPASSPSPIAGRGAITAALLAGLVSLGALALSMPVHADDQDTIDYRQHIMKTMGDQLNAIQLIVQHKLPPDDEANFVNHVKILAMSAATAKAAFTPKVAGGESKANVWTGWADFSKRMDALAADTADLQKTAESGGVAATASKLQALTCKGCHDQYRQETNSKK